MKRITALLLALLLVMGSVLIPAAAENELFEEKAPALTEEAGEEDAPEAAGAEEKEIVSPEEPEGEPAGEPAQEEEEEPEEPAEEPEEPAEEEPAPAVGGEEPAGEPEGEPEGGEPEGTPAGEPEGTPAGEPAGEPAPAEPEAEADAGRTVRLREDRAVSVPDLIEEVNGTGRPALFTGDAVAVYRDLIAELAEVPFRFAPPHLCMQRAGSVAALARAVYLEEKENCLVSAADFRPVYLRKPQAEREREAMGL